MPDIKPAAFVLRIAPGGESKVPEAVSDDQVFVGWPKAEGLLDSALTWEKFREIVRAAYHAEKSTLREAGAAAGHLWRFVRDIKLGDLIVVPFGDEFFVAEITGPPTYDASKKEVGTPYRRSVRWLNGKKPIPRRRARAALLSRMKAYGTCTDATDLLDEIKECLTSQREGQRTPFRQTYSRVWLARCSMRCSMAIWRVMGLSV